MFSEIRIMWHHWCLCRNSLRPYKKPSLGEIKCQNPKKKVYRPKKSAPITCESTTAPVAPAGNSKTSLGRCGDIMNPENKKVRGQQSGIPNFLTINKESQSQVFKTNLISGISQIWHIKFLTYFTVHLHLFLWKSLNKNADVQTIEHNFQISWNSDAWKVSAQINIIQLSWDNRQKLDTKI